MIGKKLIVVLSLVSLFCLLSYGQSPVTKSKNEQDASEKTLVDQSMSLIRHFSETYKLGPGDVLAIRVKAQPDYTVERVKVSPMGTIFHPLLGDLSVASLTLEQLKKQLARDLGEFIVDPVISLELVEAQSAKIAVVGEVKAPKIILMNGPVTVLEAINEAGGFTTLGSRTGVKISRLNPDGSRSELKVNVKKILGGNASPGENLPLMAGDTVVVHGNMIAKLGIVSALAGFTSLFSIIQLGAR